MITGDYNIVHGRWQASFRVPSEGEDPIDFIKTVGDISQAGTLVACIVEKALVDSIGRISIDDFTRGDFDESGVVSSARKMLKDLNCGIDLVSLSRSAPPQVPLQVVDDFMAVNKAESAKLKAVKNA